MTGYNDSRDDYRRPQGDYPPPGGAGLADSYYSQASEEHQQHQPPPYGHGQGYRPQQERFDDRRDDRDDGRRDDRRDGRRDDQDEGRRDSSNGHGDGDGERGVMGALAGGAAGAFGGAKLGGKATGHSKTSGVVGALVGALAGYKLEDAAEDWKDKHDEKKDEEKKHKEEEKWRRDEEKNEHGRPPRRRSSRSRSRSSSRSSHHRRRDSSKSPSRHERPREAPREAPRGGHYAGGYTKSSHDIHLDEAHGEWILRASCGRLDGSRQSSTISLNKILENDSGSFRWSTGHHGGGGGGGPRTHTVQPGDTLRSIAAKYGGTFEEIARHNGISNPDLIYPGQVLQIPGGGEHHGGSDRGGNFGASARHVRLVDGGQKLEAELRNENGDWIRSSVVLDERIKNENGTLRLI